LTTPLAGSVASFERLARELAALSALPEASARPHWSLERDRREWLVDG